MKPTNLTLEDKAFFADILHAVIKYQDNMDELHSDPAVDMNHEYMLDLVAQGKKLYPEIFNQYDFNYKKDRMVEFDNLQKFINDYYKLNS